MRHTNEALIVIGGASAIVVFVAAFFGSSLVALSALISGFVTVGIFFIAIGILLSLKEEKNGKFIKVPGKKAE